ncbi:MAG: zinc metallopeptidase [Coriobacteriia bacterium]|nr:zinc metallopeptidase [Coriobacteriia bacterium]
MLLGPQGWIIFIIAMVSGLLTQSFVRSAYRKNSRTPLPPGLTGAAVARRVLDSEGLHSVAIEMTPGKLTDHYDPRTDVLRLSEDVYHGQHVSAAGIAAHEAGHAVQHARGFLPARLRMSLVPVANLGSQSGPILVMLGLLLGYGGGFSTVLIDLGILLFAAAVLFQFVALPVEFDASKRALAGLTATGSVIPGQESGARAVLTAAALTYVASALISVLYLAQFIGLRRD